MTVEVTIIKTEGRELKQNEDEMQSQDCCPIPSVLSFMREGRRETNKHHLIKDQFKEEKEVT